MSIKVDVEKLVESGDKITQLLGAGGTSTGSGGAVQNPPAGGAGGGHEDELQKLMKKVRDLSGKIGQLKTDEAEAESRAAVLVSAMADLSANFVKEREGLEILVQFYKDQVRGLNDEFSDVLQNTRGAAATAQLHAMRVEKEQLRMAKEAAEAEVADLVVKLADAQKALADEKGSVALTVGELQKKLDAATQAAKKADQEKGTLNQTVASLEQLRAAKDAAKAEAAGLCVQLGKEKKLAEEMDTELRSHLADVEKARDEAFARVMRMRHSYWARRIDNEVP